MPKIGKRIVKSAVGILVCYLIHMLRGGQGIVFYSQLAVLWCIQPYIKDSIGKGIQRTIGTMVGAVYGLIVILICQSGMSAIFDEEKYYAVLVALGVLFVLYTTVVLKKKDASYFSAVVFLSIVVNHIQDVNPFLFVWNRVLDTMIGIIVGVGINMARIPRKKRKDILFISGIDETLLNEKEQMSPFSRIEINRMLDEGVNFTVSTLRTPASIIEAMGDIHWRLPVVVMDGSALYDMKERRYIKTAPLDQGRVEEIKTFFKELDINCFINTVIDDMLVICYQKLKTDTEKLLYSRLRRSVYRNMVCADLSQNGEVLYIMSFGEKTLMDRMYTKLKEQPFFESLRVLYYPSTDYPGNMYIKIYDKDATKEHMVDYLKEHVGLQKTMTFGSIEGKYDIVVSSKTNDVVAHTLERVYEPFFFEKVSSIHKTTNYSCTK